MIHIILCSGENGDEAIPNLNFRRIEMIKETVGIAGATALLLPPLGIACLACGLPGLLVVGAGFLLTDSMVKVNNELKGAPRQPSADEGVVREHYPAGPNDPY